MLVTMAGPATISKFHNSTTDHQFQSGNVEKELSVSNDAGYWLAAIF